MGNGTPGSGMGTIARVSRTLHLCAPLASSLHPRPPLHFTSNVHVKSHIECPVSLLYDVAVVGKGTCIAKSGTIYDGDWKGGMREGFGVKSVLVSGVHIKEYTGSWREDKKHVRSPHFARACIL